LEKPGLLPPAPDSPGDSSRRPADVYLPTWIGGSPAALDFAVSSPQRQDFLTRYAQSGGSAAEFYEVIKRNHLDTERESAQQGISFVPMIAGPSGCWGPQAVKTLTAIARVTALKTDGPILGQMFQALCITIRRASARAVLRRRPTDVALAVQRAPFEAARALLATADA